MAVYVRRRVGWLCGHEGSGGGTTRRWHRAADACVRGGDGGGQVRGVAMTLTERARRMSVVELERVFRHPDIRMAGSAAGRGFYSLARVRD